MRKKQQETEKEQPGKQGAIKEEWCPPNQMLLGCQVSLGSGKEEVVAPLPRGFS